MFSSQKKNMQRLFFLITAMLTLVATPVLAQTEGVVWEVITQVPSPSESNSWFPDLAVDSQGNAHVVWSETGDLGYSNRGGEGTYYSVWNGKNWMQHVDLLPPQVDIIRTAITIDDKDQMNLIYDSTPPFSLYYKSAPADLAYSVNAWSHSKLVNERSNTYYSDIIAYGDYLHLVYDDGQFWDQQCYGCANIYYQYSPDRGKSWSTAVALYNTTTGSSRSQIDVDQNGALYVAWDEGWDRLTGLGNPEYGIFMYSGNNGVSWSDPLKVDYPNSTNMQLTVGADGKGGVMLVWRTVDINYPGLYFTWSQDYGKTWSSPQTIPNFYAREFSNFFDVYDMATDSDGHIHLLAVGYLSAGYSSMAGGTISPPGLYHLEWDGEGWKKPTTLYKGAWHPEYPRLVIHNGNELHAVWFLREKMLDETEYHEVWYAKGLSNAPHIINTNSNEGENLDNVVVEEDELNSQLRATVTETPDFNLHETANRSDPFSEVDEYLVLAISMIPVSLLGLFAIIRSRAGN